MTKTYLDNAASEYYSATTTPRLVSMEIMDKEMRDLGPIFMGFFKILFNHHAKDGKKYILCQNGNDLVLKLDNGSGGKTGKSLIGFKTREDGTSFFYSESFKDLISAKDYIAQLVKTITDPELKKSLDIPQPREIYGSEEFQELFVTFATGLNFTTPSVALARHNPLEARKCMEKALREHSSRFESVPIQYGDAESTSIMIEGVSDHQKDHPVINLVEKALESNRGVVIGTNHNDFESLEKLISDIGSLKGKVTELFVEVPGALKPIFDKFNETGDIKQLHKDIAKTPAGALKKGDVDEYAIEAKHHECMDRLWLAAFKAGIKVIPVDEQFAVTKDTKYEMLFSQRMQSDVPMAYNIMSNENPDGKFLYVVGMAHQEVSTLLHVPMISMIPSKSLPQAAAESLDSSRPCSSITTLAITALSAVALAALAAYSQNGGSGGGRT